MRSLRQASWGDKPMCMWSPLTSADATCRQSTKRQAGESLFTTVADWKYLLKMAVRSAGSPKVIRSQYSLGDAGLFEPTGPHAGGGRPEAMRSEERRVGKE